MHLHHIAIVDDEPLTRALIGSHLTNNGYNITECQSAAELDVLLATAPVDIVIMDILLPGKDGLTMTRELRARSDIGIILVSQKNDDIDRIVGLEIGADDYVCKPFNPRELLARVKSLLRRRRSSVMVSDDTPIVRFGSWQFDLHGRTLLAKDGTRHRLTSGEYQLLATLIQHPGKVLSRERLQAALSSNLEEGGHRSVDVLIGRLRRKLNDDARNPSLLVTVHGEGYIFSAATY